jgi:hypothetical protein
MRLSSFAAWSLTASLAGHSALVGASVMEFDLVFPRHNEVYEPTPYMPVIFAIQNPLLTQYTTPRLGARLRNLSNPDEGHGEAYNQGLNLTNWFSNETFFAYTLADNFANEGNWTIAWDLCWNTCGLGTNDGGFDGTMVHNCSGVRPSWTDFTTRKGGRPMDLVAATANGDNTCVSEPKRGYAFNVSDEVLTLSPTAELPDWATSRKCVMASLPNPPLALEYCRVKVSPALAANISADITAHVCAGANPPSSCPSKSSAWRPAATAAGWCFMAAAIWGASSFLLV